MRLLVVGGSDAGIAAALRARQVDVRTGRRITSVTSAPASSGGRLRVAGTDGFEHATDVVLVVTGVRPDTALARTAGVALGAAGAIAVDEHMRTGVPHVWAAGDCVTTRHLLLGESYLPLGTTAHKQGRVAGENATGGQRSYPGSLGTQVVKVFDLVVGRTGLTAAEGGAGGYEPYTTTATATDHNAYYPGATSISIRICGDHTTGRLLGVQLAGALSGEIDKRLDVAAAAIHAGLTVEQLSDLDLSYTPPLGTPWDAVQVAAQAWEHAASGRQAVAAPGDPA